jgi:probable HAF family extracellular repeat protein
VRAADPLSTQWTISDLSALRGGLTYAGQLNNAGQVLGRSIDSNNVSTSFIYSNGFVQDLGFSASRINDSGQVVGTSGLSLVLLSGGVLHELGSAPGGGAFRIDDFNNVGQVAGRSTPANSPPESARLYLYSNGNMEDMGAVDRNVGVQINDLGQSLNNYIGGGGVHGYLVNADGSSEVVGGGGRHHAGNDLNNLGQVVGEYELGGGYNLPSHAFLYGNGSTQDLGTLGGVNSSAQGMNNVGQVVGYSDTLSMGRHAFLYSDGGMYDLNSFAGVVGSGWSLTQAVDVNDAGQILGYGSFNGQENKAFLLSPVTAVPEPQGFAMLLLGLGLTALVRRRKKNLALISVT